MPRPNEMPMPTLLVRLLRTIDPGASPIISIPALRNAGQFESGRKQVEMSYVEYIEFLRKSARAPSIRMPAEPSKIPLDCFGWTASGRSHGKVRFSVTPRTGVSTHVAGSFAWIYRIGLL